MTLLPAIGITQDPSAKPQGSPADASKPGRGVSVWAAGSTGKIQNRNRTALPHDCVWNAKTRTVTVSGVRGETVPFHLVVSVTKESVSDVTVRVPDLHFENATLPASRVHVHPELEDPASVLARGAVCCLTVPAGRTSAGSRW